MATYTFEEIQRGQFIDQCNAILPNRMRCSKPGFYKVLSDSEAKKFKSYQVCKMHKNIMEHLGTTVGPIRGIEGTGTVAKQDIPQKELEPRAQNELEKKIEETKNEQSSESNNSKSGV